MLDTLLNTPRVPTIISFDDDMYGFGGKWDLNLSDLKPQLVKEAGISIKVFFKDGTTQEISDAISRLSTGQFWGFVSDNPFKKVTLTAGNQGFGLTETYHLDDLVYSSSPVSQTPVPAAAWIFITGLAGMISLRKKNRK